MWDSGTVVVHTCIWVTFDLVVIKVICASFAISMVFLLSSNRVGRSSCVKVSV